jgi:hypothetical protein
MIFRAINLYFQAKHVWWPEWKPPSTSIS